MYSDRPIELEPGTSASQNEARALAIWTVPLLTAAGASADGIASGPINLIFIVPLDIFSTLLIKRWAQFDPGGMSGTKLTSDNLSVFCPATAGLTEMGFSVETDSNRINDKASFLMILSSLFSITRLF